MQPEQVGHHSRYNLLKVPDIEICVCHKYVALLKPEGSCHHRDKPHSISVTHIDVDTNRTSVGMKKLENALSLALVCTHVMWRV